MIKSILMLVVLMAIALSISAITGEELYKVAAYVALGGVATLMVEVRDTRYKNYGEPLDE